MPLSPVAFMFMFIYFTMLICSILFCTTLHLMFANKLDRMNWNGYIPFTEIGLHVL